MWALLLPVPVQVASSHQHPDRLQRVDDFKQLSSTPMRRVGMGWGGGRRRPTSGSFGRIPRPQSFAMNIGFVGGRLDLRDDAILPGSVTKGKAGGGAALLDGSSVITICIIDRRTPQVRPVLRMAVRHFLFTGRSIAPLSLAPPPTSSHAHNLAPALHQSPSASPHIFPSFNQPCLSVPPPSHTPAPFYFPRV
jgi:hypothetical protein